MPQDLQGYVDRLVAQWGDAKFVRRIDAGNSATVYQVVVRGTDYALKVYDPKFLSGENRAIELRRLSAQMQLREHTCDSLVGIQEVDEIEDTAYLLMEYLPWNPLSRLLEQAPRSSIAPIIERIAAAARFLDQIGLVHRDIKPANILVSPDFKHTKLVDLGVIRPVDGIEADATDHGLQRPFVATAQYSSPEYLFRLIEPSAELWRALTIYQIGGVLHDLIMRKPLFNDAVLTNNRYVLAMAVYQQTPAVVAPDVEPYLINLARKCLQKDHQKRLSLVGWGSFIATRTSFDPNAARAELGLKRSASVQRSIGASASDDRENELMLRGLVDDVRNVMSGVVDEEGYPSPHWISHGNSLTIVMPCRCATGECADVSLLIRLSMRSATEPIEVTVSSWLGEAKSLNLDDGAASFLLEPNEDQGHLKRFLSDELLARFYRATLMLGAGSRIGIVLAAGE